MWCLGWPGLDRAWEARDVGGARDGASAWHAFAIKAEKHLSRSLPAKAEKPWRGGVYAGDEAEEHRQRWSISGPAP